MPALSDHVRRDAEHAARSEIRIQIGRYMRRLDEAAKATIATALEKAAAEGRAVDGTEIGRAAAAEALDTYFLGSEPQPAVDTGGAAAAIEAPRDEGAAEESEQGVNPT